MTREKRSYWNAEVYDRIGKPMRQWAQQVIADLNLRGDETVLDAGCGSGSVTFDLLERLPSGKIWALDYSPQMVEKLEAAVAERGIDNIVPMQADLADFALPEQVDVVFSNAVFHWVPDDDGLFGSLATAAKPGAQFRAQCGGFGNIDRLMDATHEVEKREPYVEYIPKPFDPRKYRTAEAARAAMERNGWREVEASLFDSPQTFESHDDASLYLRTVILQQQSEVLPDDLSERFLRDVIAEVERRQDGAPFVADYVRLDLWAARA